MKLYLARHGDATSNIENPERPLSPGGRDSIEKIAGLPCIANSTISSVMHSNKLRARQTAEILATGLAPGITLRTNQNINPMDSPDLVAEEIVHWQDDTLLVGHLPHMANLTSLLLTGDENMMMVRFMPGTIACLETSGVRRWTLAWLVSPEIITSSG